MSDEKHETEQSTDLRTEHSTDLRIGRRMWLKLLGAAGAGLPLTAYLGRMPWKGSPKAKADSRVREDYWKEGGYFVQDNVDASQFDQGVIRARIDGEWRSFVNRPVNQDFIDWNFAERIDRLTGGMSACLDGAHSGALATYGANRGDSSFTLNNAFKGFGFFPKESDIDDALDEVLNSWNADIMFKAQVLLSFYQDQTMWDFRLMSSLELYTTQEFETHSFLNQMANPIATICWLAIPGSYEARCIARLLHPLDPNRSDMDMRRHAWVCAMHDYYHGGAYPNVVHPNWIGAFYYNVELFDNSPYPGLMGVRVVPKL